jgi:diguanylate cyclase (GGDEF)-like protein
MVSDREAQSAVPVTHLQPRIAWLCGTLMMAALIAGLAALIVVPGSVPILALAALVPLIVVAPHVDPRSLSRAAVTVGALIITFVAAAAAVLIVRADAAIDVRFAFDAFGAVGLTLLVLSLLERSGRTADGLRDAAVRDGLTGLHDRTLFIDRLEHAMARSQRSSAAADHLTATTAVVYLDIDAFKDINDRHGHGHGDAVLRAVADRLRQMTRAADTIARIGGDEFAVLVEEVADRAEVVALTERLMESMTDPVALPGGAVAVRLSAGLAFSDDGGGTARTLLQNADHAMDLAKRRSEGGFLIYDPALWARSEERRRLKRALHGVVERDELRLHYQPLVRLHSGHEDLRRAAPPTGTIAAFEALVRWQEPTRGLLLPAEFVEVAEETGDIMPLGRWVLETACRQLRAWQQLPARGATTMMVNLSALEIEQRGFSEDVRRIVADSGIAPHSLVFEITEYAVVPDRSQVRAVLDQLQDCGVHLVIDDFGTGYSSLSYLSSLPVDGLKIPRAFVRDAVGDKKARTLLRAIIEVGAALGAVVVAEGIETREEMLLMRSLGCDLGQGHLFSRPLPAADVEALLGAPQPPWAASLRPSVAIPVLAEPRLEVPSGISRGAGPPRR